MYSFTFFSFKALRIFIYIVCYKCFSCYIILSEVAWYLQRPEEDAGSSGAGVAEYVPRIEGDGNISSSLQEQNS